MLRTLRTLLEMICMGNEITVYPNAQHEQYEDALDEDGIMTSFGDLPAYEHDPYVDDNEK